MPHWWKSHVTAYVFLQNPRHWVNTSELMASMYVTTVLRCAHNHLTLPNIYAYILERGLISVMSVEKDLSKSGIWKYIRWIPVISTWFEFCVCGKRFIRKWNIKVHQMNSGHINMVWILCLWKKIYQKVEYLSTSDEFRSYQHDLNSDIRKKKQDEFWILAV